MELLSREISPDVMETIPYEKVEEFQYLSVLLNTKNEWSREIGSRITKVESAFLPC